MAEKLDLSKTIVQTATFPEYLRAHEPAREFFECLNQILDTTLTYMALNREERALQPSSLGAMCLTTARHSDSKLATLGLAGAALTVVPLLLTVVGKGIERGEKLGQVNTAIDVLGALPTEPSEQREFVRELVIEMTKLYVACNYYDDLKEHTNQLLDGWVDVVAPSLEHPDGRREQGTFGRLLNRTADGLNNVAQAVESRATRFKNWLRDKVPEGSTREAVVDFLAKHTVTQDNTYGNEHRASAVQWAGALVSFLYKVGNNESGVTINKSHLKMDVLRHFAGTEVQTYLSRPFANNSLPHIQLVGQQAGSVAPFPIMAPSVIRTAEFARLASPSHRGSGGGRLPSTPNFLATMSSDEILEFIHQAVDRRVNAATEVLRGDVEYLKKHVSPEVRQSFEARRSLNGHRSSAVSVDEFFEQNFVSLSDGHSPPIESLFGGSDLSPDFVNPANLPLADFDRRRRQSPEALKDELTRARQHQARRVNNRTSM